MSKLRIVKYKAPGRRPRWWILGLTYQIDDQEYTRIGPYMEYRDALEDKRGMEATLAGQPPSDTIRRGLNT